MNKLLSKHVLKQSIKNNWKLWLVITGLLCFFIMIITIAMQSSVGETGNTNGFMSGGLITMYGTMLFGMQGLLMTLVYSVITGNKLVASEIDRGTMSFTLNTPITRRRIIFSKALFYVSSIVLMSVLMGIFGTVACAITGAAMDYGTLWLLVLGLILLTFAISGISFAASCWFNKSGHSLIFGAGIPVISLICGMFAQPNLGLEWLKYFSINTLFDATAVISGTGFIIQFIVLALIGIALYAIGITKFLKKDLPL